MKQRNSRSEKEVVPILDEAEQDKIIESLKIEKLINQNKEGN